MTITYSAATFTATRDELTGANPLLGSAEIARGVCRSADRHLSVLAIDRVRMRRIDGWLGDTGFVTHAGAPDSDRSVIGSLCDRDDTTGLVWSILESLVGELGPVPAGGDVEIDRVAALSPSKLPVGADWVVLLSANGSHPGAVLDRFALVGAAAGGLAGANVASVTAPLTTLPLDVGDARRRVDRLVGRPPRSVRELLAAD